MFVFRCTYREQWLQKPRRRGKPELRWVWRGHATPLLHIGEVVLCPTVFGGCLHTTQLNFPSLRPSLNSTVFYILRFRIEFSVVRRTDCWMFWSNTNHSRQRKTEIKSGRQCWLYPQLSCCFELLLPVKPKSRPTVNAFLYIILPRELLYKMI